MPPFTKAAAPVVIQPIDLRTIMLPIVGDTPLICHNWSEKSKRALPGLGGDKPTPKKRLQREPEAEFLASLYPMPDGNGYGFPSVGFKKAAIDACSHVGGVTKVEARGAFHVQGEFTRIDAAPTRREDIVRLSGMGNPPELRWRGEFVAWRATLSVVYNAGVLSAEQIANLFNIAGFAIGVGEWRPQKNGSFGMFHVETTRDA